MFSKAIVRQPSQSLVDGLTSAGLGKPDIAKALAQHQAYIQALQSCGLEVQVLDADDRYPDAVFIEDIALLTPYCAIITRPGAPSRRAETAILHDVLPMYFQHIETIQEPGTLEAGDIMMVDDHYYSGLTARTNAAGAEQLIGILQHYGMSGSTVAVKDMLHLKTGLAYLEQNKLLISQDFIADPTFKDFYQLQVPTEESYAANSIWVNGTVLLPAGYPQTKAMIEQAGYPTMALDVSEFRKLDGGLSCLSLRF